MKPYVLGYITCFAAGMMLNSCMNSTKYTIKDDMIHYKKATPRSIKVIDDRIVVGTLEQRMVDIVFEDPYTVRRISEQIINAEIQSRRK